MTLASRAARRRAPAGGNGVADDAGRARHVAEILKAVAHPVRVRVVAMLSAGPANVSELSARLRVPQPIVSQQLRILRLRRLVSVERRHGFAVYRLAESQLRYLIRCMDRCEID